MNLLRFSALFLGAAVLSSAFVARGWRRGAFRRDRFPTRARRNLAAGLLLVTLLFCVAAPFAAGLSGRVPDVSRISPLSAFAIHIAILIFLTAYYAISGRIPLADFLHVRTTHPFRLAAAGIPIAALAWVAAVAVMLAIQLAAAALGSSSGAAGPRLSPIVPWIVSQPAGFKIAIVSSAMIFEEAFFRCFLQPRIGAVGATLFFTLAHGVYGEPAMLVGILVLSAVLAAAFELFRNGIPGIVAHGAFDAFEIFVLIPLVLKLGGGT